MWTQDTDCPTEHFHQTLCLITATDNKYWTSADTHISTDVSIILEIEQMAPTRVALDKLETLVQKHYSCPRVQAW